MMLFKDSVTIFNYSEERKGYVRIFVDNVYFKNRIRINNTKISSDEKNYNKCVISEKCSKIKNGAIFIPDFVFDGDDEYNETDYNILSDGGYKKIADIKLTPNKSYICHGFTDEISLTKLQNNCEIYKILEYAYQGLGLTKGIYIKTERQGGLRF